MADYYTLLQRAISGLPENTPETRGAIYERARTVLVQQLRNVEPPLADADIDREYAALDLVIARIEAEARPREEPAWPQDNWPDQENLHAFEQVPQAFDEGHASASEASPSQDEHLEPYPAGTPQSDLRSADADGNGSPGRERPRLAPVRPKRDWRSHMRTFVVAGVLAAVVAAIAGVAVVLRDRPVEIPREEEQAAPQEQGDGKFTERLGGEAAPAAPPAAPPVQTASPQQPPAQQQAPQGGVAVAQRASLYEESPDNPQGAPLVRAGRTTWRIDSINPGQGEPLESVVHADVEVPEAGLSLALVLRRNRDTTLPASHTVELTFRNTSGDPARSVRDVGVMQLKADEGGRGTPLAGLPVPVTENIFLIGLSNLSADMERNASLLKSQAWIDLPLRFANGRRAVLAFEKGVSGDQAINEAFRLWQ
ncbi:MULTISPECIES: histidine kinase [unclassified Chelatococcus]|uniref:histidine kinase n=1 Tax=unclassified Chelatococcus TaxID=2638111 RepID=UPI001BCC2085|nr:MULTISPECIES: histidine kinase [unclassified Chelatococcus]MBS7696619.1 histidine kinase [Chelatococcus sp. YT9]MBX3555184.1 histidine kinase [Chelatococcus sp.]